LGQRCCGQVVKRPIKKPYTLVMQAGVLELQKEYQDYVLAWRLRRLLGGKLKPKDFLSLPRYAQKRLKRQDLARAMVTVKPLSLERLGEIDDLTDELCFGLWRNPREINDFLRAVWRRGGHAVFEHTDEFAAQLLSETERQRLPQHGLEVAEFYMACLKVGAAALNPDEMGVAVERVESMAAVLPVFIDELA
jgi:hypothetical protein